MKHLLYLTCLLTIIGCESKQEKRQYKTIGSIERIDPSLDSIISADAKPEIIAEGFEWSEGPLWVESQKMLLFSDVPRDTVYKWTEEKGLEVYLTPSGYTDSAKRGGEMGSNGLLLDKKGRLVLCQHGNRQVAIMDAPLDKPAPLYTPIVSRWEGARFNSPNDAVFDSDGSLFITDPPYGLEKHMNDPKKEIPFQGVYCASADGRVTLINDSLTRPNGIAFLPGDKILLVANSDPDKPNWYAFNVDSSISLVPAKIFLTATSQPGEKGLPDGLKVDSKGNVFASGPGGIWIFTKDAKLIGKIRLTEAASNCALSPDEKTLYITNDMYVLRLKMR